MSRQWDRIAFFFLLGSLAGVMTSALPCRSALGADVDSELAQVVAQKTAPSVELLKSLAVLVKNDPAKYLPGVLAVLEHSDDLYGRFRIYSAQHQDAQERLLSVVHREFWHVPEVAATIARLMDRQREGYLSLFEVSRALFTTLPGDSPTPISPTIEKAVPLVVEKIRAFLKTNPLDEIILAMIKDTLPMLKAMGKECPTEWYTRVADTTSITFPYQPLLLAWQKTYPGPRLNALIRHLETRITPAQRTELNFPLELEAQRFAVTPWEDLPSEFHFRDISWPRGDLSYPLYPIEIKSSFERFQLQLENRPQLRKEAFEVAFLLREQNQELPFGLLGSLLLLQNKTPEEDGILAKIFMDGRAYVTEHDLGRLSTATIPPLSSKLRRAIVAIDSYQLRNLIPHLHPHDLASPEIQGWKDSFPGELSTLIRNHSKLSPEEIRSRLNETFILSDLPSRLLFQNPRQTRQLIEAHLQSAIHNSDLALAFALVGPPPHNPEQKQQLTQLGATIEKFDNPNSLGFFLSQLVHLAPWALDFNSSIPTQIRDQIRKKIQSEYRPGKFSPRSHLSPLHQQLVWSLPIEDPFDIMGPDPMRNSAVPETPILNRADVMLDDRTYPVFSFERNPNLRTVERYHQYLRTQKIKRAEKSGLPEAKLTTAEQNRWVEGQVLEWKNNLGEMSEKTAWEFGIPEMERSLRARLSFAADLQSRPGLSPQQKKQMEALLDEIHFEQFRAEELQRIQADFRKEIRWILAYSPDSIRLMQNHEDPVPGPDLDFHQLGSLELSLTDSKFPVRFKGVPVKLGFSPERALGIPALNSNTQAEPFEPYLRALTEGIPEARKHALGFSPILRAMEIDHLLGVLQSRYQKLSELVFSADSSVFEPLIASQTWTSENFRGSFKNWLLYGSLSLAKGDFASRFLNALDEVYFSTPTAQENRIINRRLQHARDLTLDALQSVSLETAQTPKRDSRPQNSSLKNFLEKAREKRFKVKGAPPDRDLFILSHDGMPLPQKKSLAPTQLEGLRESEKRPFRLLDSGITEVSGGLSRLPHVELSRPVGVELWSVPPDSQRRQKLIEGKDYRLRKDPQNNSIFIEYLTPGITHVQGEYAYSSEFKKTPVIQIGTENLPSTIQILKDSGFTDLASQLEAWRAKNPRAPTISHLELGKIAQKSSYYSFVPPRGKPAQNPTTLLDSLRPFIGPEGKTCLQCNGAAPLFKALAELLDPDGQFIEVDLVSGHLVGPGQKQVTAQDFHMRADVKKAGDPGPAHSFEVTPPAMDPANPNRALAQAKHQWENFRLWLGRVAKWRIHWAKSKGAIRQWWEMRGQSHLPSASDEKIELKAISIPPLSPELRAVSGPKPLPPIHGAETSETHAVPQEPHSPTTGNPQIPIDTIQGRLKKLIWTYRAQLRGSSDEPLMRLYRLLEQAGRGEREGIEAQFASAEKSLQHLQATEPPYNQSDLAPIFKSLLDSARGHLGGRGPAAFTTREVSTRACELDRLKQALHQAVKEVSGP